MVFYGMIILIHLKGTKHMLPQLLGQVELNILTIFGSRQYLLFSWGQIDKWFHKKYTFHCHEFLVIYTLVHSTSKNHVISTQLYGLICRKLLIVPWRYLSFLFIHCQWFVGRDLVYWVSLFIARKCHVMCLLSIVMHLLL